MDNDIGNNIGTVLICVDCNNDNQSVRNAFKEGDEGNALLSLNAARKYSGPDNYFLATITPVNEREFYDKHDEKLENAHRKLHEKK
jgi:hypothetical protein